MSLFDLASSLSSCTHLNSKSILKQATILWTVRGERSLGKSQLLMSPQFGAAAIETMQTCQSVWRHKRIPLWLTVCVGQALCLYAWCRRWSKLRLYIKKCQLSKCKSWHKWYAPTPTNYSANFRQSVIADLQGNCLSLLKRDWFTTRCPDLWLNGIGFSGCYLLEDTVHFTGTPATKCVRGECVCQHDKIVNP